MPDSIVANLVQLARKPIELTTLRRCEPVFSELLRLWIIPPRLI
ncbi:hypothetical protein [Corynebacterium marambiense]